MTTFAIVICQKKVCPLVAVAIVAPVTPRMCKKDALEKVIDGFMRTSVMRKTHLQRCVGHQSQKCHETYKFHGLCVSIFGADWRPKTLTDI